MLLLLRDQAVKACRPGCCSYRFVIAFCYSLLVYGDGLYRYHGGRFTLRSRAGKAGGGRGSGGGQRTPVAHLLKPRASSSVWHLLREPLLLLVRSRNRLLCRRRGSLVPPATLLQVKFM